MIFFDKQKKEKLKAEIETLENEIEKFEKNVNELQIEKNSLEKEINNLFKKKTNLDIEIKKRENYFIERELIAIDTLTGLEFESYFANILLKLGYNADVTKASNDNGGDIIATKDGVKYVFQCKNYSDKVGNKAVQEVYSAKGIYKCDKAIVITNNYFTNQAIKEAEILSVELWDRKMLEKLLYNAFQFDINHINLINDNLLNNRYYENANDNWLNNRYYKTEIKDEDDDTDEFLIDAIDIVIETGQASTTFIQRRFKIGYARAGRIMDQMEARGIISGYEGSKPREVLITKERWQELKLGTLNTE